MPRTNDSAKELRDLLAKVIVLNENLEQVIAFKPRQPGVFHGKIDFAQPPWNAPAANAILDLHADVRRLENILQLDRGLPERRRGCSSANTVAALKAMDGLCAGAGDFAVRTVFQSLDSWCRRASIALSLTEAPKRIPRLPGEPEMTCPWCKHHTLRLFALEETVRCIDPECLDEEERRPEARMKYSPVTGDFLLIWQDKVAA